MDWAALESAAPQILRDAAQDPDLDVAWAHKPQTFRADRFVDLTVEGIQGIGRPERRDAGATVRAEGVLLLQVVVVVSNDQPSGAVALANRLSVSLPGSTRDVRSAPFRDGHGRVRSRAIFEWRIPTSTLVAFDPIDAIESVDVHRST